MVKTLGRGLHDFPDEIITQPGPGCIIPAKLVEGERLTKVIRMEPR